MARLIITFRYIALFSVLCLLSGCLGGTVAQQIARSIATSVADKAVARAMDVDEDQLYSNRDPFISAQTESPKAPVAILPGTAANGIKPQTTKPAEVEVDDYTYAMATFGFAPVKATSEPLPEQKPDEIEAPIQVMQGNQLVQVELFNLLIGEEKNVVYEKARLLGANNLPQKREWQSWGVGTGTIKTGRGKDGKVITFLIPPEFGKLPSGAVAVVELANPGDLNIARYKAKEDKVAFKALANR
jgi:hypothetical protein